ERRRPEGLECRAHGAKRSAQPRNTAQAKRRAVRTAEARRAGVSSTRSKAQCAATEHRASEAQGGANGGGPKGWSVEHTEQSAVRSHGTPRKRSAGRCERRRPEGLECRAHGAKRSAQPRNTAQAKRRAVRTAEARRAGVSSTRSKAQ